MNLPHRRGPPVCLAIGLLCFIHFLLWLANNLLVVAPGLAAFELPLQYIQNYKFNQPILGCNNLSGMVRGTKHKPQTEIPNKYEECNWCIPQPDPLKQNNLHAPHIRSNSRPGL